MTKRGIVVEVQRHKAIILTKDGSFETISIKKKQNLLVGQEVDAASFTPAKRTKIWIIPSLSTAAAALIVFLLFVSSIFPFQHSNAIAAYVSFDINPSIEVGVNKSLEVVNVRYLNEDGENLFSDGDIVKHMPLEQFSKELIQRFKDSGYFNAYEHMLIATAVEVNNTNNAVKESLTQVLLTVEADPLVAADEVQITMLEATLEKREAANDYGISFGKYALYAETLGQENLVTIEEIQHLSYDELYAKISNNHHVVAAVNEASPPPENTVNKDEETILKIEEDIKIIESFEREEVEAAGGVSVNDVANQKKFTENEEVTHSTDDYENNASVSDQDEDVRTPAKKVEKQTAYKEAEKKRYFEDDDEDDDDDDENEQEIEDEDDEQEIED